MHALLTEVLYQQSFVVFGQPLVATLTGYGILILLSLQFVYVEYVRQIFVRALPPPISVWTLWLLLDVVATAAEFAHGRCNIQLIGYTIGTGAVCVALLRRRVIAWDRVWDNGAAILVLLAIGMLYVTENPDLGLLISLFGMTVASVPLVRSIIAGDADESPIIWGVIFVGSVLSVCDGNTISGIWLGLTQIVIIGLIMRNQRNRLQTQ